MSPRKPTGSQTNAAPEERLFTGQEIGEFLLHACHDLRTSLRAIRAHAQLLGKGSDLSLASGGQPHLGFIVEGAGKIDQLVDELSSYSIALQIGPGPFGFTPLGVLLRTVLARLDKELRDNQAEVTSGEMPRVSGDPDRLMQLFENLLRNALDRRGQLSPRIHITARAHAEGCLCAVQDNGPVIEAADLENIFQPFARPQGVDRPGHGLRLAACREIVQRHGGRIWVESQAGTGCTFLFTLPAADSSGPG